MLYTSPIQEELIAGVFIRQVTKWHAEASTRKLPSAAAMEGDLKAFRTHGCPERKFWRTARRTGRVAQI